MNNKNVSDTIALKTNPIQISYTNNTGCSLPLQALGCWPPLCVAPRNWWIDDDSSTNQPPPAQVKLKGR